VHTGFWCGDPRERDHLKDIKLDGRIILKCIFENWAGDMDWIDLFLNRDSWREVS
jgi:hypothetical protein